MPTARTQRLMMWLGMVGTVLACAGCGLLTTNRADSLRPAQLLLAAAWLVLVPLFMYLVVVRSRASAEYKRRQKKRQERQEAELEALASLGSFEIPGPESPPQDREPDK